MEPRLRTLNEWPVWMGLAVNEQAVTICHKTNDWTATQMVIGKIVIINLRHHSPAVNFSKILAGRGAPLVDPFYRVIISHSAEQQGASK